MSMSKAVSSNPKLVKLQENCVSILNSMSEYQLQDYSYNQVNYNLKEQRDFLKVENDNLKQIQDKIAIFSKYIELLHNMSFLVNTRAYTTIYFFKNVNFDILIPSLLQEVKTFVSEYEDALKYTYNGYYNANIGLFGEDYVDKELKLYKDKFFVLNNIRMEEDNLSVESDFIVISHNGIFCIEVKNYGAHASGGKIKILKDGTWKRYNADNEEIDIMDVTSQVYRHIGITQRIVNNSLKSKYGQDFPYIPFAPIITIANSRLSIENSSDMPIIRTSNIFRYISNFKDSVKLDNQLQQEIKNIIEANNMQVKSYPVKLTSNILIENYKLLNVKLGKFIQVYNALKLEDLLYNFLFSNSTNLVNKFKIYSASDYEVSESADLVSPTQVSCIRGYIEQLNSKFGIEREIYESMIKYFFKVDDLNHITPSQFSYICNCFNETIAY
jgi:hypothetical protein